MRWPIGSLIKGLSYGWTAGSLAGDLPFWHLQIAAMLQCPTDPYIPMRNRWTRSGTIENHGISWFRGNMWCTKLAIEKSSEGPALVFLFYKIVQCYVIRYAVCRFFKVKIQSLELFWLHVPGFLEKQTPRCMTFHSWDAPFPLEHASTLPCVQSFDLWSSPCHFILFRVSITCSVLFSLN